MARNSVLSQRVGQLAAAAVIVALVVVAAVLSIMALNHAGGDEASVDVPPAPSFTAPALPTPSSASDPADDPEEEPVAPERDAAAERFLTAGSETLWRGIAGTCATGDALVEMSTDGGSSWDVVTPWEPAARQLLALDPFMGNEAQLVAAVGDDCEPTGIRTFTQAVAWAENPEGLRGLTYIDPAAPVSVVIAGRQIEAPCESPWGLRAGAEAAGVICDGIAYALSDEDTWLALEAAQPVALATAGESLLVAHTDAACDGLAITSFTSDGSTDSVAQWCAEGPASAGPAAIAAQGDSVLVWWDEVWLTL